MCLFMISHSVNAGVTLIAGIKGVTVYHLRFLCICLPNMWLAAHVCQLGLSLFIWPVCSSSVWCVWPMKGLWNKQPVFVCGKGWNVNCRSLKLYVVFCPLASAVRDGLCKCQSVVTALDHGRSDVTMWSFPRHFRLWCTYVFQQRFPQICSTCGWKILIFLKLWCILW